MGALLTGASSAIGKSMLEQRQQGEQNRQLQEGHDQATLQTLVEHGPPEIQWRALQAMSQPTRQRGGGGYSAAAGLTIPPLSPEMADLFTHIKGMTSPSQGAASTGNGVQQTAPQTGAPASAAMPATAVTGEGAPPPPQPGWQPSETPDAGGVRWPKPSTGTGTATPPKDTAEAIMTPSAAPNPPPPVPPSLFRTPEEQVGLKGKAAEAEAEGKLTGTLTAVRKSGLGGTAGSTGDAETDQTLYRLGVFKPPPTPNFQGNVSWEDATPAEKATFPQGQPGQAFRREYNTITRQSQLVPISPEATMRPSAQTVAGPQGEPERVFAKPGQPNVPIGSVPQKLEDKVVTNADQSTHVSRIEPGYVAPKGTPAGGAPPAPAGKGAAPAAAPQGPQGRSGAPGAAQPSSGPAGAPPSPQGVLQTKAPVTEQVVGTFIDPDGSVHEGVAFHNPKGPGSYLDAKTGQPVQNFIPGKLDAGAGKLISGTTAAESTVDAALNALVKTQYKGRSLKDINDPQATADMFKEYYSGKAPDNPAITAALSLQKFADVQIASEYATKSRAYKWIQEIQAHLPRIPSEASAAQSTLLGTPGTVQQALHIRSGYDSPQQMYQKLLQAKKNLANTRQAVIEEQGKGLGGNAPHPNSSLPDGSPFTGPDGKSYIKTGTNPDGTVRGRLAP